MNVEKIFEDENVLVINKPVGVTAHSDGKREEETLADWFVELYPESSDVGESMVLQNGTQLKRPGIVHRLDRDTSGVMILVKNQETFLLLKEQFQNHTVEKEYRAFVYGNLKENSFEIDRPIGRSSKDFRLWSAQRGARGKMREALTDVEVLDRAEDSEYTHVRLLPKTGRTHQLRVHLKAVNHPIVCDPLYAPKRECGLGFKRLALHAHVLSIEIPTKDGQETQRFEAPLPDDFENALNILRD